MTQNQVFINPVTSQQLHFIPLDDDMLDMILGCATHSGGLFLSTETQMNLHAYQDQDPICLLRA
tara:strand:+ start:421 stop:612 length:192 start_codon:yes stop_codon:yes gene_type:complete